MQFDYLYADLCVQVTFDAGLHSPFAQLTDTEVKTLQQTIYMALNEFQYVRALYAGDIAALKEVIENVKKTGRPDISGG